MLGFTRTFKKIISEHAYIPFKMSFILYILMWIYSSFNHDNFDYAYKFGYVIGAFIIYTFVRLAAEFISFNNKTDSLDVYSINDSINKKIKNLLRKFMIDEDGIYEKKWKLQENGMFEQEGESIKNPIELYYTIISYLEILKTIGSYSSMELCDELYVLLEKVKEILEVENLENQHYAIID